jgi:hypothetical protein
MSQELQVYKVYSALPFVERLHHTSVLCKLLGWQIFLVTDCTERIAGKISQFCGTEQWECHHHGEIGNWIARALHDHNDIDTSQRFYDFVVASGEDFPAQVRTFERLKNNFGAYIPESRKICLIIATLFLCPYRTY